jgi:hypothetical protein
VRPLLINGQSNPHFILKIDLRLKPNFVSCVLVNRYLLLWKCPRYDGDMLQSPLDSLFPSVVFLSLKGCLDDRSQPKS